MKIKVNEIDLFELSPTQIKVLENDIQSETCHEDLCNRLKYILTHKYDQCLKRLKEEWIPKLKENGVSSIPLNDDEFANLVFSHPDYMNRSQRDLEEERIARENL